MNRVSRRGKCRGATETFRVVRFHTCSVMVSNSRGTVSEPIPESYDKSLPDYSPSPFCAEWRDAMLELFDLSVDPRASMAHFCTVAAAIAMAVIDGERTISNRMVVIAPDVSLSKAIVAPFKSILHSRRHYNTYVNHRLAAMSLDDFDSPEHRAKFRFQTDSKQTHPFMFHHTGIDGERLTNTLHDVARDTEKTGALFNDMLFRFARYKARGYFIDPSEKETAELREMVQSTRKQREQSVMFWIHSDCEVINGSQIGASLNECHDSFLRYCRRAHKMPCQLQLFRGILTSMGFEMRRMRPITGRTTHHVIGLLPRAEII